MLLHCYSLLRKSFGIAAFRAKPAQGDDAYISVRVIRAHSLGSCKFFWRVKLKRYLSLLWRWTIIIILDRVWASSSWPRICCSQPQSRHNSDLWWWTSWDGESMGYGNLRGADSGVQREGFHIWAWKLQSWNTTRTMLIQYYSRVKHI